MKKDSKTPETQNEGLGKIALYIKKLKFKKRIFGGVDEADVWKKIEELNKLYEQQHEEERLRYDVLLEERIAQYQAQVKDQLARKFSSREGQ